MKQQQVNGNARRGNDRELTFRSLMAGLRARRSLNAEEIQELADALSRLWREKSQLYYVRISRARKMLGSMLDGEEPQVQTTVDSTSPENHEVLTTVDSTSPEKSPKEAEKENPPCTPLKEKGKKNTHISRARGVVFTTPTLDECKAYAASKGLAMDVAHFHDHYASNGWKISGRAPMKDWRAAMRNWARCEKTVRPLTVYERKRAEFELEAEAIAARKEASRRAAIAALTAKDWELCADRCANCSGDGCRKDIKVPPDHQINARPCNPEECPLFAAKEGGAA